MWQSKARTLGVAHRRARVLRKQAIERFHDADLFGDRDHQRQMLKRPRLDFELIEQSGNRVILGVHRPRPEFQTARHSEMNQRSCDRVNRVVGV
jgi:hypothetical protein